MIQAAEPCRHGRVGVCNPCYCLARKNGRCACGRPLLRVRNRKVTGAWVWGRCACGVTSTKDPPPSTYKRYPATKHGEPPRFHQDATKRAAALRDDPEAAALSGSYCDLVKAVTRLEERAERAAREARTWLEELVEVAGELEGTEVLSEKVRAAIRERSKVLRHREEVLR